MYSIIGAGIGGLTTALVFEKLKIPYLIFEKAEHPNAIGAGIWLAPNALSVLNFCGVLEAVFKAGNEVNRITLTNEKLNALADSSQIPAKEKYGFSTVAIHRGRLQQVLVDALPKDKIIWNKSFSHYIEDETELSICFDDDTIYESNYLIAADGITSNVRQQLFPESQIRYSGQTCWRGVSPNPLPLEYKHRGCELWGKGIRFGFSQLNEHETSWFAVKKAEGFGQDHPSTLKEELLNIFKDFHAIPKNLITTTPTDAILRNDITDLKPLKQWYKGKVLLTGDAAHATTPNMGQGGAQAIEDAYYLGHYIKSNPENAFKTFQESRYQRVNNIVKQSWFTGKIAHFSTLASLRNFIFKHLPKALVDKNMHSVYQLKDL
jgi:2-polyprenyl-6-methoxyphenol hydroxylase-like FAD-dependent oxidoreductase